MRRHVKFILSAVAFGQAYIDLDGCLLKRMRCPPELGLRGFDALLWWAHNLKPMPIIRSRLALLYVLRFLGVKLYVWTNRWPAHDTVTREALGVRVWLFKQFQYHDGQKILTRPFGPVMDDQEKYLTCGVGYGLLVEQK